MPLLKNTVVEGGQQLESPYLSIVATLLRKIYVIWSSKQNESELANTDFEIKLI